jgi:hypothetical protein
MRGLKPSSNDADLNRSSLGAEASTRFGHAAAGRVFEPGAEWAQLRHSAQNGPQQAVAMEIG